MTKEEKIATILQAIELEEKLLIVLKAIVVKNIAVVDESTLDSLLTLLDV